ncbi:MAG: glycosyltransferase family 39 protein [Planctomycetota bacterium]|jgi:4-amino-4-deoxy-L-arabinose transferase-like glycosyltransferase
MTRRDVLAGAFVFLLALALRVAYVQESERVLALDVSQLTQTDNYVFAEWARTIADGDILCREQPHAYHLWTRDVAPESRWLEWYGGESTYHQAPLYPYVVAGIYTLFGRQHIVVGLVQAVLGALTCLLTFVLARRLVSFTAGLSAGLLLALMSSFYFYDAFLLRDGMMAPLVVLLALAADRAVDRGRPRDWFLAGAALGLFTLAKETGVPLLAIGLAALVLWLRRQPRRLAGAALLLLLGWGLVCAPAFLRNREVGAPTFKLSTRGPEVFVTGNAQGQDGVGWDPPTQTLRRILMDSNFQLVPTVALTLATHRADPLGYARLLWAKTTAFFNAYEVPNNVNFYLHRAHLTSLRLGFVSMGFVAPAALLGLLIGLRNRRRLATLYLLFLSLTASVIALYILGRFRVQVVPLMAVFAGISIDWAISAWRARRRGALLAGGVPFALFLVWASPPQEDPYNEQTRDASIMLQLVRAGNFEQALLYRDRLEEIALRYNDPSDENLRWKLDTIRRAFDIFEGAGAWPDDSAEWHVQVGRGLTELLPITKRAERLEFTNLARSEFEQALQLDPKIEGAQLGLGSIELQNERLGEALGWISRELAEHPKNAEAHLAAGLILRIFQRDLDALPHFLHALAYGLEDPRVLVYAAYIEINGTYAEAPPMRVDGQAVPPYDPGRALVHARRALELAPEDVVVREKAAYALYANDLFDEAVELLRALIVELPDRADELEKRIEGFRKVQAMKAAEEADGAADADADAGVRDGDAAGSEIDDAAAGVDDG